MTERLALKTETELESELIGRLNEALEVAHQLEPMHGCAPIEYEEIDTNFLPGNKKIVVTFKGPENCGPMQYYMKTDAHDPRPFHMPHSPLVTDLRYDVSALRISSSGLVVGVGYQGQGYNFFYTGSLDNLDFNVTEKSDFEKTRERLGNNIDLAFYDQATAEIQDLSVQLAKLQEIIEGLPNFDIDSPLRYSIDLFIGGRLYKIHDEGSLQLLDEFGPMLPDTRHGHFIGNRVSIANGKTLLIDDVNQLAVGAYYSEGHGRWLGFSYFKLVDTEQTEQSYSNTSLADEFSSTY